MGYATQYDDVRGTVIGDCTNYYIFIRTVVIPGVLTCTEPAARGHFTDDAEAIAWFKENYPADFANGVEMRVYD